MTLRLYKKEKLCSEIAINKLFSRTEPGTESSVAFPLLARWRHNPTRAITCPRFLVSVPKKRIRHAVDRVTMRRRIREAYRLSRHLIPADVPIDIAFTYVSDTLQPYSVVARSMEKLLGRISRSITSLSHDSDTDS